MSNVAPPTRQPIRSPARDFDAEVGRALGLTVREAIAEVRPGSPHPPGTLVTVHEHLTPDGRWVKLPAFGVDASVIPTLIAALLERFFSFGMWTDGDLYMINEFHLRAAGPPMRTVQGKTLMEALCRAVIAAAGADKAPPSAPP